ncbi:hypothetical protein LTS18_010070, partial [Coniosporium uncinatum]
MDIAKELGSVARRVYQSSRGGQIDFPPASLPENALRIGALSSFTQTEGEFADFKPLAETEKVPAKFKLESGDEMYGVHTVVLCTGYHITLPFLSAYHDDNMPVAEANDTVLLTDGTQMHNLHMDIFYIPDPTSIFVGVPYYSTTFTLFDFQAMAVAAFLSGK